VHGPTCILWANLTPFSLFLEAEYALGVSNAKLDQINLPWAKAILAQIYDHIEAR
jgi:hypothetical protein